MNKELINKIDSEEVINLLKTIISIKSMSWEEQALAEFVQKYLSDLGMETRIDHHGNVYGEYRNGSPTLLFNTHLDNVPVNSDWKTNPFESVIQDGLLYGRGACDPKGSLAGMLIAVKTLLKNTQLKGSVIFMGAATEEISPPSDKGTYKGIMDGAVKDVDMAICGEPTDCKACITQYGRMEYRLKTFGKAAHANAPEKGINSILHMAELVKALDSQVSRPVFPLLGKSTFNIGMINGGVQSNIVPATCEVLIDQGLVPGQTHETALAEMIEICDAVKSRIPDLNYQFETTYTGYATLLDTNEPIVKAAIAAINEVHGTNDAKEAAFTSHCDGDWLITFGHIPTLILGPGSLKLAHTSNEYVPLAEVIECAKIYTLTADHILNA